MVPGKISTFVTRIIVMNQSNAPILKLVYIDV